MKKKKLRRKLSQAERSAEWLRDELACSQARINNLKEQIDGLRYIIKTKDQALGVATRQLLGELESAGKLSPSEEVEGRLLTRDLAA